MTTAGRTLRISAPTAGSKSINQTSPRFGVGTVDMEVILAEGFKGRQFRVVAVIFLSPGGGLRQDSVALLRRQFPQFGSRPVLGRARHVGGHDRTSESHSSAI